MDILLLVVGLGLILAGANFLTDGSAALAQRFRVPEFIIGLTIVAVGTSAPELVVSLLSSIAGKSDVAIGNVVGSNIFNVFLILGVCALIRPLPLTAGGRGDGVAMLVLYILLIGYTIRQARRSGPPAEETAGRRPMAGWLMAVMIAGGLAGLIFGGELFLDSATSIARKLGVSESVIALTLVAGGTSLPELASSVVSLVKGKSDMALGNVIGSNIANILLILGLSATIRPLTPGGITIVDFGMVVLSSLLLFVTAFTFRRRSVDRWEGALFLAIYVAYLWYLIR